MRSTIKTIQSVIVLCYCVLNLWRCAWPMSWSNYYYQRIQKVRNSCNRFIFHLKCNPIFKSSELASYVQQTVVVSFYQTIYKNFYILSGKVRKRTLRNWEKDFHFRDVFLELFRNSFLMHFFKMYIAWGKEHVSVQLLIKKLVFSG